MNFLAELRRRSVFRVTAAYLVAAWVVMQVIGFVADASTMPDWTTTFVLILVIAGLPIVIIVAWAFELTPEGPKLTGPREEGETIKPFRPADTIILAALVTVIGVVVWQQLAPREAEMATVAAEVEEAVGPEAASIAVLAFDDLSPEGNQEYFSDGISEELLNVLVRVEGLRVASRTSAFRFKGSDASIPEIAADLQVRHVLEGSVRRSGETVRITAQLIDSATDEHLWSETYDREMTTSNIFEVQDDIATAIVAALSERLLGILPITDIEVENTTTNLNAYELYLRARRLYLDRRDFGEIERLLSQAVELDPEFADAWELRGASFMLAEGYGGIPGTREELLERSKEYNEIALRLDPNSSLALATNAFILGGLNPEPTAQSLSQSIEGLTRAIELDPHNVSALNWRAVVYFSVGHLELSLVDRLACVELEPTSTACQMGAVSTYSALGEHERAYEHLMDSIIQGNSVMTDPFNAVANVGQHDFFMMIVALRFGSDTPWGTPDVLYEILRNPTGDFGHLIPEFEARWDDFPDYRYIGPIIGAYPPDFPDGFFVFNGDEYARYRQSPEYQEALERYGVAEFWRQNGFPSECRERDDGWIECD